MRHTSDSATLPQTLQNFTSLLTRSSVLASRSTSVGSVASRWKAMRCALFGPTPGSRPSSSIRSWTAPSYMDDSERQAHAAETSGERTHLFVRELGGGPVRVAHGGHDEVLQGFDVVGIDGLGIDGQRHQLA